MIYDREEEKQEWVDTQKKWLASMTAEQREGFSPYRTDLLEHILDTIGLEAFNKLPKHPNKWVAERAERLIAEGIFTGMNI